MKKPTLQELSLRERIGQTGVAYPAVDLKNPNEPFGVAWSVGGLKMAFVNMDFTPNENLKMTADAYAEEMARVNASAEVDLRPGAEADRTGLQPTGAVRCRSNHEQHYSILLKSKQCI